MVTTTAPEYTAEELVNRLARMPAFECLPRSLLRDLARIAKKNLYPRSATIVREQETVDGFYLIESGRVKITRHTTMGREHIVNFLHAGENFNLVPTLDKGVNPATVIALIDTTIWHFPMAALRPLMAHHPRLIEVFARLAAQHTRELITLSDELALLSVKERVARFLLRNLEDTQNSVPCFFTYDELANHLGTAREVISRQLGKLKREKVLEVERDRIVIHDKFTLQKIANATMSVGL